MALMGNSIALLILTKIFLFNYLINKIQEKVRKITAKRKIGISDFKFEFGKMLIMKFC